MPELQAKAMIELIELRQPNAKTFRLGPGKRQLHVSVGAVHYRDNQGKWQDVDRGYSEPDTAPFNWKYNKLPFGFRLSDDSTRRIYPDRNDQSYWLEFGKILPDMGVVEKVKEEVWKWNHDTYDSQISVDGARVKLGITLKSPAAPTSFTIPFSFTGLDREGLVFKHNGEYAGEIRKPEAIDAEKTRRDVDITFEAGEIVISLDATGLVYPIQIDPTWQVGAGSDDACRRYVPSYFHLADINWAGANTADLYQMGCGMRFQNITIPQGATIENGSKLTFHCFQSFSGVTCNSRISAEAVDDAVTFADNVAAFDARWAARTTARVDWEVPPWVVDNNYDSPEIKTVIQENVDRGGWASGQAMVLFWDDFEDRTAHIGDRIRYAESWNTDSSNAPKLVVTYTVTEPGDNTAHMASKMLDGGMI